MRKVRLLWRSKRNLEWYIVIATLPLGLAAVTTAAALAAANAIRSWSFFAAVHLGMAFAAAACVALSRRRQLQGLPM